MRKIYFCITSLFLFILLGCEKENLQNELAPELNSGQSSKNKIEKLSFDELSKDKKFDEISSVFKLDETLATAKNGETKKQTLDENDFEIDFTSGNKFESKNGVSYTFIIKNDEENPKHFENFVVEKHNDGTVSGFIVYYEYSQRYLDSLKKGIVIPFDGTVRRTVNKENLEELKDLFKEVKTGKPSKTAKSAGTVCVETSYVTQSLCPAGVHSPGQYCDIIKGIWFGYHMETVISCVNDGNTSTGWGWVANSSTYTSTVPDPNVTSGGGSYSTTATVQPNLFDDVSLIQRFVNEYGLTGNKIEWARYRPNRNMVEYYREDNGYSSYSKTVVISAIDYFMTNPTEPIEKFENQFMGVSEGQDGTYDAAYWEDPNLIFPQQNLPTFASFRDACPSKYSNAETVCNTIGGSVLTMYNAVIAQNKKLNTCAIRISRALNYSGVIIPSLPDNSDGTKNSVTGADGKNYIINAKALNVWMRKTFGTNSSNYLHFTASQGGVKGVNFPKLLANIKGIYSMVAPDSIQSTWGTGHADLLENGSCLLSCHFYDVNNNFVPINYIDVWILN